MGLLLSLFKTEVTAEAFFAELGPSPPLGGTYASKARLGDLAIPKRKPA